MVQNVGIVLRVNSLAVTVNQHYQKWQTFFCLWLTLPAHALIGVSRWLTERENKTWEIPKLYSTSPLWIFGMCSKTNDVGPNLRTYFRVKSLLSRWKKTFKKCVCWKMFKGLFYCCKICVWARCTSCLQVMMIIPVKARLWGLFWDFQYHRNSKSVQCFWIWLIWTGQVFLQLTLL